MRLLWTGAPASGFQDAKHAKEKAHAQAHKHKERDDKKQIRAPVTPVSLPLAASSPPPKASARVKALRGFFCKDDAGVGASDATLALFRVESSRILGPLLASHAWCSS